MSQEVIAIFDIGKTNKKFFLFNRQYETVFESSRRFEEIEDEDGFPCDDLPGLHEWIKYEFREISKNTDFDIKAINFSAYGASLVHLNDKGVPVAPLYNYLKPLPEDIARQFYETYGQQDDFAIRTASPAMGMLNSGLQLYWLKYKKHEVFQQIKTTLHFPQYLSYLITKKAFSEITSIGCHTALWDFQKDRSHDWVYAENLNHLFPPVVSSSSVVPIKYKKKTILCGVGVHDSSSALVPYLLGLDTSFMLMSSGTWIITFNPFSEEPLSVEDLKRDCLQYMNFRSTPTRASRIFLGNEHNHHEKRLAAHFHKSEKYHQSVFLDKDIMEKLLANPLKKRKFFPQTMQNTGPFPELTGPETNLSVFKSYEEAYHQLVLDLVCMQAVSLKLAKGSTQVEKVLITGGFCENTLFMQLLAGYFPEMNFYTSTLKKASAIGAALVLHRHWNEEQPLDHLFDFEKIEPLEIKGLQQYQLI